ncbi:ribonuclease D [Formicincola oecophyllae]|uniref:Ribonuclease D n=1 Tax=Formicincola oecophyllae TaxID=2558361 RepID=A0A4Y6UD40_9PROT|nr:ribonuclease D [Formicincola oecophyllae]QDH14406.1 ribonuclease D [Formicincola oecophyllae]
MAGQAPVTVPTAKGYPDAQLLSDPAAVAAACQRLAQEPFVTVDTEFVRERTYWPQLCLVQLAGAEEVVLIDALAPGMDLAPLGRLLACPECVKVFHAARQDLEIFLHLFGALPVNVFDTQIAAMVAGLGDQIGYDSLVALLLERPIDKGQRFTDWAARPLSAKQCAYAAADVTHLRDVYLALRKRLEADGRLAWLKREMVVLEREETFLPDPRERWRKLKARTNSRRMLGVLQDIVAWREELAQKRDVPRQHLFRDESLLEIAASQPTSAKGLARVRGVSAETARSDLGMDLLAMVAQALERPEEDLPSLPQKPKHQGPGAVPPSVVALLRALLAHCCAQNRLTPRLVASPAELERFAAGERELEFLKGWRGDVFGKAALALLEGTSALALHDGETRLVAVK